LIGLRRLVVLSILLVLAGLALLLPSSDLYSLLTKGTTSTGTSTVFRFAASSSTSDNTTTIESLVGFGLIGVGVVLEVLSLFTDVGGAAPARAVSPVEVGPPAPSAPAPASPAPTAPKPGEKKP
jgi:hypothetical protein